MDERLVKAQEFANYRVTLQQKQEVLKLKMQNALRFSSNGGTFHIDRELIAFAKTLLDEGLTETVLLDINENPILITNLKSFYETVYSKYFEATNEYVREYTKLRKARRVSTIVGMD